MVSALFSCHISENHLSSFGTVQKGYKKNQWDLRITPTSTVLILHLVPLEFIVILCQKFPQGLGVRQVGLHVIEVEGHFSFV